MRTEVVVTIAATSHSLSTPLLDPAAETRMTTVAGPPIVVGSAVPEEAISTDDMIPGMPIVAGRRLNRAQSFRAMEESTHSVGGQAIRFLINAAFGLILPLYALYVNSQYGYQPCDKPVASWLSGYGWVGIILGVIGLYINLRMLLLAPIMRQAALVQDEQERAVVMAPALPALSMISCLSCCCLMPLGLGLGMWWLKGNFDVWGTFPRDDISPDESIATFRGCAAPLLHGARFLLLLTYATILTSVCSACCMCAMTLGAVARAAEQDPDFRAAAQEFQAAAREARGMV